MVKNTGHVCSVVLEKIFLNNVDRMLDQGVHFWTNENSQAPLLHSVVFYPGFFGQVPEVESFYWVLGGAAQGIKCVAAQQISHKVYWSRLQQIILYI